MEKERDELAEALDILEAHLGTGTRQHHEYASEDGTRASRVKNSTAHVTTVLRCVSKNGARSKEHEIEEIVSERVARLITHQAGAKGCSSLEIRKMTRQSPRLQRSAKSDKSAGSDMRSGSQPPKHTLKSYSRP